MKIIYNIVQTIFVSLHLHLSTLGLEEKYDVHVNAHGGGLTGQTEAIRLGLARALCKINPENRTALKFEGYLNTRFKKN